MTDTANVDTPNLVDFYTRALAFFGEQVQTVDGESWDLPTPCNEWDTRALVAHVVIGEAALPPLVRGESVGFADIDPTILGKDPMATWRGTALAALEVVRATPLDTEVDHPVSRRPLSDVLGFRITDNLVHAWDLAVAVGNDVTLNEELALWCLDFWLPMADRLAEGDFFSPMLQPADDSPSSRLLGLLGRST